MDIQEERITMKQLQKLYQKYNNCITNVIFPVILLLYPLVKINQGIDVSDSTYSLGNYMFFPRLKGTWVISTYLSNVFGWILTKLPFGDTMPGMNLYTGLIVSALTIGLYCLMRKWMPAWIVFVGEFIAIGFLWIPTTILYNYLTYVCFALGAVFLYKGLVEEKNKILVLAGVMLGLNVWVRIPNLAEMALIVCVWYYCYLQRKRIQPAHENAKQGKEQNAMQGKKQNAKQNAMQNALQVTFQKTGFCIAGYAIGVVIPLIMILIQYGFGGIAEMVQGLFAIQSGDESYSILSMIGATMDAYGRTGKWVAFIVIGIVLGLAMFALKKEAFVPVKKLLYLGGIVVLLRFFWGRGMFSFRYYEDYTSMYEWGMIGLYLALAACVYLLFGKGVSAHERLWGMISLVVIMITPLGSNNYTYQNLNNLFLVAPITVYAFAKLFRRRYPAEKKVLMFPWKAMVAALACMILIQSVGFHFNFVFRDGMDGTPRDTVLTGPKVVDGMKTTQENAENLGGLLAFIEEQKKEFPGSPYSEMIYYGDCPGLPFLLQTPSALDSSWPDLDSFPVSQMEENLMELKECPAIVIRNTEPTSDSFVEKQEMLQDYMSAKHYQAVYENDGYTVYEPIEK